MRSDKPPDNGRKKIDVDPILHLLSEAKKVHPHHHSHFRRYAHNNNNDEKGFYDERLTTCHYCTKGSLANGSNGTGIYCLRENPKPVVELNYEMRVRGCGDISKYFNGTKIPLELYKKFPKDCNIVKIKLKDIIEHYDGSPIELTATVDELVHAFNENMKMPWFKPDDKTLVEMQQSIPQVQVVAQSAPQSAGV